jgi:hypothetical protein
MGGHERDRVLKWIRRNISDPVMAKTGWPHMLKTRRLTWELLYDLETQLVFIEVNELGRCRANISKTQSYSKWRAGLEIVNSGLHEPLRSFYHALEQPR